MIPAFAGTPSGSVRVLVATRPVDFRKGMGGLAALVKDGIDVALNAGEWGRQN